MRGTWEPLTGSLLPEERLQDIDAAIGLVAPGTERSEGYQGLARSVVPQVARFQTLVEDAFALIGGDLAAGERFREAIRLLEDAPGAHAQVGSASLSAP